MSRELEAWMCGPVVSEHFDATQCLISGDFHLLTLRRQHRSNQGQDPESQKIHLASIFRILCICIRVQYRKMNTALESCRLRFGLSFYALTKHVESYQSSLRLISRICKVEMIICAVARVSEGHIKAL